MICKICGNEKANKKVQIREMMFGSRDEFNYIECSNCGCLQIAKIPDNIGKYYPENFYSFNDNISENSVKKYLRMRRNEYAYFKRGLVGRIMNKIYPPYFFDKLEKVEINLNSRILDVGCGSGRLIYSFKGLGFKNLTGIDPYTDKTVNTKELKILQKTIYDMDDHYDLIILKNVFEHQADQLRTLKKISELLDQNGSVIITIPIKNEYIWNKYEINWVQIDAPRHFFIHTFKSLQTLIEETDLEIKYYIYDSDAFQFWGSEQYENDIPLMSDDSFLINPKKNMFSNDQIKKFGEEANILNNKELGDHIFLVLERKNEK